MSDFRPNTMPEYPSHVPAKKRSKAKTPLIAGATGLLALFAGVSIGVGGEGAATAEPAETITATETVTATPAPETITETVTEEVEVEVTPDACLTYITLSEEVFSLSADMVTHSMAMVDAVDTYDLAKAEGAVAGMEEVSAGLDGISDQVLTAKEQCRGAGA